MIDTVLMYSAIGTGTGGLLTAGAIHLYHKVTEGASIPKRMDRMENFASLTCKNMERFSVAVENIHSVLKTMGCNGELQIGRENITEARKDTSQLLADQFKL